MQVSVLSTKSALSTKTSFISVLEVLNDVQFLNATYVFTLPHSSNSCISCIKNKCIIIVTKT